MQRAPLRAWFAPGPSAVGWLAKEFVYRHGVLGPWWPPTLFEASELDVLHYAVLLPSAERCVHNVATREGHGNDEPAHDTCTISSSELSSITGTCCPTHRGARRTQRRSSCRVTAVGSSAMVLVQTDHGQFWLFALMGHDSLIVTLRTLCRTRGVPSPVGLPSWLILFTTLIPAVTCPR